MSEPVRHAFPPEQPSEQSAVEHQSESLHVDWYETTWIRISLVTIVVFAIAIIFASVSMGIHAPGVHARIDPNKLMDPSSPFANPALREIAPGEYEVYIRAQVWTFAPAEIRVPVGAKVTFYVTSQDVQHGFKISETNINMMVIPGQIGTLTATFDKPGTYNFICHEYCGAGGPQLGHHTMYGQIIVE